MGKLQLLKTTAYYFADVHDMVQKYISVNAVVNDVTRTHDMFNQLFSNGIYSKYGVFYVHLSVHTIRLEECEDQ